MVKISYICIIALGLCCALFLCPAPASAQHEKSGTNSGGAGTAQDSLQNEWSLYSYGLFYKNLALEGGGDAAAAENLDLALSFFRKALEKGESPDRVHNQISDCYYHKGQPDLSVQHARLSIQANKNNPYPYLRIYRIMLVKKDNEKAARILEDFCAVRPYSVYMKYELGGHYYSRLHDLDKSEKIFQDIVRLSATRPVQDYYLKNSYGYLGFISYKKHKLKRASRYFQKAHDIDGEDTETLFFLAHISMLYNDLDAAEKYSAKYLQLTDENHQIHSILGRVYYLKEDPRAVYHLGMVKDSQTVEGLMAGALYHELLGHDSQALGLIDVAVQVQPKEIPLYLALARISLRKNRADEAFKQYYTAGVLMYTARLYGLAAVNLERADALKKDVSDVHYYIARCHEEMGDYYSAIRHYRKVNDMKPSSILSLHIGYLYGVKRDYNTAMSWFGAVAAREPKNPQAYFYSGIVSLWKERFGDAEMHLKNALALEDTEEPYYFYLAVTMEKTNRLHKAIDYLKLAIKRDDKSARSLNYLGYLYAENNMELDRSQELIEKALKIEPKNGAYVDSLGWVHFRKGNYKMALEKLLMAEKILIREKSPDPLVYDHIGDTYHRMGEFRRAIEYWNKSVKLEKNEAIERKILHLQKLIKKEKNS